MNVHIEIVVNHELTEGELEDIRKTGVDKVRNQLAEDNSNSIKDFAVYLGCKPEEVTRFDVIIEEDE